MPRPLPRTSHALALCTVLALIGQGLGHAEEEVIARAGAVEVTNADIVAAVSHLSNDERQALLADAELQDQIVRSLLVQRLVLKEATNKEWEKRPEIASQLKQVMDSAIVESYLKSLATPPESYPSASEISEVYETNKAAFFIPKSYRLAQIYIDTKPDEKAAKARLDKVVNALKAPKSNFAAIAKEHSQEKLSAPRGGEIGWLTEAQIQPEILAQLPLLQLNVVSDPIKFTDGWHILKVLDVKEASTPTLDQVKPRIVQELRTAKLKSESDAYLAGLIKANPVAVNELALPKALANKSK